MMGHQREILAELGIDVWAPRDMAYHSIEPIALWRDQVISEIITTLEPTKNILIVDHQPTVQPREIQVVEQQATAIEKKIELPVVTELEKLELAAFSLQALVLNHLVILVDVTTINEQQSNLWKNIQRSISAEFFELNWPFAMADMKDGHGVENYIQGFVDMMTSEHQIMSLGTIPHWKNSMVMNLASLQEMLDNPLLKRRLWNFIQNKQVS